MVSYPEVVFSIVKQQPHFAVSVGEEDLLKRYHVSVLEFSQEL